MGGTFGTNGGKKHTEFWWASLKKKMSYTRTRLRCEDNIRIGLKEVESEARNG